MNSSLHIGTYTKLEFLSQCEKKHLVESHDVYSRKLCLKMEAFRIKSLLVPQWKELVSSC